MIRISELTGVFAGLALFLGTLIAAQAFITHETPDHHAEISMMMD